MYTLMLSGSAFAHVDQTKYLGVMLNSTGSFKCSFDHVNIKFYRWFIVTYFRAKHVGTELVCCVHTAVEINIVSLCSIVTCR